MPHLCVARAHDKIIFNLYNFIQGGHFDNRYFKIHYIEQTNSKPTNQQLRAFLYKHGTNNGAQDQKWLIINVSTNKGGGTLGRALLSGKGSNIHRTPRRT